MFKALLTSSIAIACLTSGGAAHAQHDIRAFLSSDGLDFLATEAPSYVPAVIEPLPFNTAVGCIEFEQSDTVLNFRIDDLDISVPRDGIIRVEMAFSGSATGELYADDIYACAGELTCRDDLEIRDGNAIFEYQVSVLDGSAIVTPGEIFFELNPEDVDLDLSDCGATGDALNNIIDFTKSWILIALEATIADLASENLGPMIEDILDGFSVDGTIGIASYSASLEDLDVETEGLRFRVEGDMIDPFAAGSCVAEYDRGAPDDLEGLTPEIGGVNANHLGMAINLGMVNKGLYTVWRRGLLCLTDDHIRAFGLGLDLSVVGALLPGFPAGTTFSFDLNLSDYPKVRPEESLGSTLTVDIGGIILDLHGDRPDGSRNTLHVELDIEATATLSIDPSTNAIVASLDNASILHMSLQDERDAVGAGFDVARIIELVEDHILPDMLEEVGTIALTGSAFSFNNYAILLRQLTTNNAFLSLGLDLFRIPDNDFGVPETEILESPTGITNPHDAVIRVTGTDAEIPTELLQYQVMIDGVPQDPSFVQNFTVGEAGVTATYHVTVAAMDLSGNIDPSPAEVDVNVDGVPPQVTLIGARSRAADEGPTEVTWSMSDDLSDASALGVRIEIYDVVDPADALSAVLIDTQVLAAGTTSTTVEIAGKSLVYRVEIHAIDEAGNDSIASLLLTNPDTSGCGCSTDGESGTGNAGLLLLALGFLVFRRKKA